MNEMIPPIISCKQPVRTGTAGNKIGIGFIENQRDAMAFRNIKQVIQNVRRYNHTRRIARRDE